MAGFPDMRARDPRGLARIFRHFGEIEAPALNSRIYEELSRAVADDPALLALAAEVRNEQPPPNILFASTQELLLRDGEAGAPIVVFRMLKPEYGQALP